MRGRGDGEVAGLNGMQNLMIYLLKHPDLDFLAGSITIC